eukprot:scaffold127626_cov17-Prasinocladus_malaysianus.AAC.1
MLDDECTINRAEKYSMQSANYAVWVSKMTPGQNDCRLCMHRYPLWGTASQSGPLENNDIKACHGRLTAWGAVTFSTIAVCRRSRHASKPSAPLPGAGRCRGCPSSRPTRVGYKSSENW